MLKSLYINNYALIDKLELDFDSGLNVITGETGAGKSIIIGALGLILGNRADKNVVNKNTNKKCIVEGVYDKLSEKVIVLLTTNDFDVEDVLRIRREITAEGKSRAFINDTPASLSQLKSFATLLIDVNSQNQAYIFKKPEFQLSMLDDLAGTNSEMDAYTVKYKKYSELRKKYNSLIEKEKEAQKNQDFIKFQFEELELASLISGEEKQIRSELQLMDNAELIKETLYLTTQKLSENDANIVSDIEMVLSELQSLQQIHSKYVELYERLNSSLLELKDVAAEYGYLNENTEFEPEKHTQLQDRLDMILHLQQKHGLHSVEELIEYKDVLDSQLLDFGTLSQEIEMVNAEVSKSYKIVESAAAVLSKKRLRAIPMIKKRIVLGLQDLGMKDANFQISVNILENITAVGIDAVDFLFSSNKGHKADSVAKVASGGELSRLVLTLKSMLSVNKNLPTVIFDEIDTGVSGDIATKVGNVMQKMADNMQVITITHLPQIAAKGSAHYKVFKKEIEDVTYSDILLLSKEQRSQEIALMISGDANNESALKMAEELMN
ncbi:MAG: DNA repair protein RecN [Bacteroidales bacterium]|nr:DNA repair protein RecN [Bacteroidales bacterium]